MAEAGSYIYEPVGSIHTLFTPEDNSEPTVVLFVIDLVAIFFGKH